MADELEENASDQLVAITRGATSLVPLVGGLLAEIIGATIPNQRSDRVVAYLRDLRTRIDDLDSARRDQINTNAELLDLIEEGGFQAARATSRERIQHIVEAVGKGLAADEADILRRKRLLKLLGQLDDDELALLNAYGQSYGGDGSEAWAKVNRPDFVHLQSSVEELDRERLFDAGQDNLLRLGMLEKKINARRGEAPEFDHSQGDFKYRVEVSYLGRLLLREIGMPSSIDVSA